MAERIVRVAATAFRGVPEELDVTLTGGRSLVVLGDNGTGKSTIADALEWYFTGRIAYLSHEGREGAIRNLAAPDASETLVEIETDGTLSGRAMLPDGPPADPRRAGALETFLLRGRTLAEFIDRTKGEKWKVLTEILGLDAVDGLRLDLQRARNDLRREARDAKEAAKRRAEPISDKLQTAVMNVSPEAIVEWVSERCQEAGRESPGSFEELFDPEWSPSAAAEAGASAATQLASLSSELKAGGPTPPEGSAVESWNLHVREQESQDASMVTLLRAAREVVRHRPGEDLCPLCRQPVDRERLSELIDASLRELQEAAGELERVEQEARDLTEELERADRWRLDRMERASRMGVSLPTTPDSPLSGVRTAISSRALVDAEALAEYADAVKRWDEDAAKLVEAAVPTAPTAREAILWDIALISQQTRDWNTAVMEAQAIRMASDLAHAVFEAYQDRQGQYVQGILSRISGRVAEVYEALHPGEGLGSVSVEMWGDKGVELAVDFHGKKAKPPHGVLSESHLNSLAIALFLGMAETFNERLGFLVLDDVVNSFDKEHRGHLAELLALQFEDRQLIVLTHDPIFFERIVKLAPAWNREQFTSWSYEEGPRTVKYETKAILGRARRALDDSDTMGAGQKGRRALEELLQEICEGLEAPLPFRRGAKNDRREIVELMKGVRRCLRDHAGDMLRELEPLLRLLEADTAAALNVEAHASLGQAAGAEVRSALDRIEQLDDVWACRECETRSWFQGTPEAARCRCGKSRFPP